MWKLFGRVYWLRNFDLGSESAIKLLHDSGVTLTVGTDSPTPWIVPGLAVHDEMALMADAGIPPLEIIRMATENGARALGIDHEIGRVEAGYVADLVVLERDSSRDIRNSRSIELVIQRGRPINRVHRVHR